MPFTVFFFVCCYLLVTISKASAFECPSRTGSYNVSDPDTKTGYYSCENGAAKLQYCASGAYFSAYSARCVAVPSAPGVNCNDGGYFQKPDPNDCAKFYKCDRGVAVPFNCPNGTHYSPTQNACDWPDRAGCVANTSNNDNAQQNQKPDTTTSNNNYSVEPVICPAYIEPGKTRLEPNPYDETGQTYYVCDSKGGVYLRFCEEGVRFNTGLGRCNQGITPSIGGDQQDQSYHW